MTPQTEMSWRDKAGVAGVSGVGGASLPIENIKDFFRLEISIFLARAKRERVVQDGVEKANRRPTRHGPAPLAPSLKFDHF